MALAIALLVGGAVFLGGRTPTVGGSLVAAIEQGDVETLANALVLEALPGVSRENALQVFGQQLASGLAVTGTRSVTAEGATFTEIETNLGYTICETPDGRALINCLTARSLYAWGDLPADAGFTLQHVGGEVYPGEVRIDVLIVAGGEPVTFDGTAQVVTGSDTWDTQAAWFPLSQAGLGQELTAPIEVPAGQAVVLRLTTDESRIGALLAGDLTIVVGDTEIEVEVVESGRFLS